MKRARHPHSKWRIRGRENIGAIQASGEDVPSPLEEKLAEAHLSRLLVRVQRFLRVQHAEPVAEAPVLALTRAAPELWPGAVAP